MKRGWYQVAGQAWQCAHVTCRITVALVLATLMAAGTLAWRLADAPLPISALARGIEAAVNVNANGPRLEITTAAIAWEGFRSGASAPVDIRLSGVRLVDPSGSVRAALPDAAATLSFRALLGGRIVPSTIELRRPSVLVFRDRDGRFSLGLAGSGGDAGLGSDGSSLVSLFQDLMEPASERSSHAALRRVRVVGGEVTVLDEALGQTWALSEPVLDVRRAANGGLSADGTATLRMGSMRLPVRVTGNAHGRDLQTTAGLSLPALRPAQLVALVPELGPLGRVDAPVALAITVAFGGGDGAQRLHVHAEAGAGRFDLGAGQVLPFAGFRADVARDGDTLRLSGAEIRFASPSAVSGVARLQVAGTAARRDGRWDVALEVGTEALNLADGVHFWPAGLMPQARAAVLNGLPSGQLKSGRLRLSLAVPDGANRPPAMVDARADLAFESLVLDLGPDRRIRTAAVELSASASPDAAVLHRLSLRLPDIDVAGEPPRRGPTLTLDGEANRDGRRWRSALRVGLDRLSLADAAAYWPSGIDNGERRWLTTNVTAGTAYDGAWRVEVTIPETFDGIDVSSLSGTLAVADATVHWLRPLPPVVGVSGTATFSLTDIVVQGRGGHQASLDGSLGNIEARDAVARFSGLDGRPGYLDLTVNAGGPVAEIVALLRHPRLKLFDKRKLEIDVRGGQADARLVLGFPMWNDVAMEDLRINAAANIRNGHLADVVLGRDLERASLELAVDPDGLKLTGEGRLADQPVSLAVDMDFRSGPAAQVIERMRLSARPGSQDMRSFGIAPSGVLEGQIGLEARLERRRNGLGQVNLSADLKDALLTLAPLGWTKPSGTPGLAEAIIRLRGSRLVAVEGIRVEALEMSLRGRLALASDGRVERVELTESIFGGSRFRGDVSWPARAGGPWQVALRGPLLDLRPLFGPGGHVSGGAMPQGPVEPASAETPALAVDLRFDRVTMGEGRNFQNLQARGRTDGAGLLREARVTGSTGPNGAFDASLVPQGDQRVLRITASDGGSLLHALDVAQPIHGGRLTVNAVYEELRRGAPLIGTAELDGFVVRDAPAIGKILQAMTLFGLVDALSGPGLNFTRLIAPFTLTPDALVLSEARAFSASLGLTAKGRILRDRTVLDLEGTIVPAYALNALLGNLPVVGRLFSPEQGGGVIAATWRVLGPIEQPQVTMNPLAALTPGFLRGLFGIVEQSQRGPVRPPVR